jgi:hypothetical protein
VQKYIDSPTRNDKTLVVISIVDYVRDRHGHFIKQQENGEYYDIGDAQARDKGMFFVYLFVCLYADCNYCYGIARLFCSRIHIDVTHSIL